MPVTTQQSAAYRENFRDARMLIIEDNPDHWVVISRVIKQCLPEIKPVRVSSPEEVVAYMEQCRLEEWKIPKLILLDLYMPDREQGWEVLEMIKSMPNAVGKVPVVLLSSSTNRNDIAEAYQRGASSYLVKPAGFEPWLEYFQTLRSYWWETATLPKAEVSIF